MPRLAPVTKLQVVTAATLPAGPTAFTWSSVLWSSVLWSAVAVAWFAIP
jgi:hypothetical protein